MNLPFYHVDSFTSKLFQGNPAGICLLDTPISDRMMQAIAAETNFAETSFLLSRPEGYSLRWFSPRREMPLCGHGTLATAHILWETGLEPREKHLKFETLSGILTASRQSDSQGDWIELDFPARSCEPCIIPDGLRQLFPDGYVNIVYSVDRYIVELPSAAAVMAFVPGGPFLEQHRCVITSRGEENTPYDFISRYFAAPVGVVEDPVTGTAHCSLATYWARQLDKTEFLAYQASQRGGEMKVTLRGDRVSLMGEAVTVIEGKINI